MLKFSSSNSVSLPTVTESVKNMYVPEINFLINRLFYKPINIDCKISVVFYGKENRKQGCSP